MQQIFNFIFKNSILLLFLLLLGISLSLVFQSHYYHRSRAVTSANAISGYTYEKINDVEQYFSLKEQNDKLATENATLKQLLYNSQDTINIPAVQKPQGLDNFTVIQSKVISNSYNNQENYLTINSGTNDGVKPDMGVVSSLGVVGIIENTSKNYATVISILNLKFKLDAKIKGSNYFGTLKWDAKNAGYALLTEVPRLASVKKGDTIVTGGRSVIFPENIPIGKIENIFRDTKTNYYTLNVRLFNDMTNLDHVYIIENKDLQEIRDLEARTGDE
ncbi:rod shape-determining protein MreC [Flavobacterium beibuense F44-8]|uniref:Cell shape-determining protein MreC n=1 Tax=Flavobacterium beibuense F44-8 TaxID=1406840 RepID=A0A0A2LMP1_9FLAO|nr:rod shape-determining protein MreC [Flavobacterium beibuense]KGO80463.1 rod shape-determining protein MreC [Flavobacterium beibuense F44-8]